MFMEWMSYFMPNDTCAVMFDVGHGNVSFVCEFGSHATTMQVRLIEWYAMVLDSYMAVSDIVLFVVMLGRSSA